MRIQHVASPTTTEKYVRPQKGNIYILDVSGSMGWACRQLAEDTVTRIRKLPLHDGVLIGIFSSPGWFRWIVKEELDSKNTYDVIEKIIREELYARNTTCFSEILTDVPRVIQPFLDRYKVFTLVFMSDGCVVVPDVKKEMQAIDTATNALKPILTAGTVVAYGDYADRNMLMHIAERLGIEFLATDTLTDVGKTFTKHAESHTREKRQVAIPTDTQLTFSLEQDGSVQVFPDSIKEVTVTDTSHVFAVPPYEKVSDLVNDSAEVALYAAAMAMVRSRKIDQALEILSCLGDVALVDAFSNALTNAGLAEAEGMLQDAIAHPEARFTEGRKPGCLPAPDAFDLFDLLERLASDPECKFYPSHPEFQYKRIGRASRTREGYPSFITSPENGMSFSRITGNEKELNLSIGGIIEGEIDLPESVEGKDGQRISKPDRLDELYPVKIHRNYALIANGLPVVTSLPVSMSRETYHVLRKHKIIRHNKRYEAGRVEVLNLKRVPVCNKLRALGADDWEYLCDLALKSLYHGSILKVLRAKRNELDPERVGDRPVKLTDAEYTFLEACGVRRDGSFSPPRDTQPTTDVMNIRLFEIKIKGGSDVTMADFQAMIDGKKKWNYVGELMKNGYHMIQGYIPPMQAAALAWLKVKIEDFEKQKRKIDMEIYRRKFAVALTGAWPKHFTEDSHTIDCGGREVTLSFRTVEKKI